MSEETKKKISMAKKGKPMSADHKENIKKSLEAARTGDRPPPTDKQRLKNLKSDLRANYNLSLEEYQLLLEKHNHVCAICKKPETSISRYGTPKRLTIDHCHNTLEIRGILCDACNRGIGHLGDDIATLQSAIEYLARTKL